MKFTHLLGMMMCVVTLLSYHLSVVAQDSSVDYSQEESGLGTPLVAPTVDNIFLRLGPDVKYIPLPAFTGGKGQLTYTFSSTPSLPQGVAFDARDLRISYVDLNGNQNSPAKSYTYTATDEDGVSASATVSITVIDAYPVAPTVPELRLVMNQPIEPVTLPAFATTSDDNPTLSYNITGLPVGLDFNAGTRRLSGIPRYFRSANTWYEATDGVDIVRTPLTITVEELDTQPVAPSQPQSLRFTAGVPVNSGNTLREFTSGNGVLTYSLRSSPRLPTGLSFNARTRRIVGTVPDNAGYDGVRTTTFTYTATDIDGDATSANFTIAVIDPAPSFSSRRIADIVATKNLPISRVRLPYAYSDSLGTGLKDYSITPSLPPRLTYNPDTRYLSGTPTVILPTTTYTYSAIGQDGDSASITFTITVEEDVDTRPVAPTQPQSLTFTVSPSTQSLALQAFTGGDGVLTYAMASTPRLPSWITFNPSTRLITVGSDTALDQNLPRRTYTYTATDEDGDTTSATFTLRVHDVMPSFGDRTIADVVTTQNSPITDVTLPAATPNPVNTYYSVSPSLPRGLTFSSSNRRLSGIPVVASPTTTYTYTARYSSGDSASLTFTITVEEEAEPDTSPVAPYYEQNFFLRVGNYSRPKILRTFSGGNGVLTYALLSTPSLPNWVTIDPATRQITVGPDTAVDQNFPRKTYTYTATDEDGDTTSATFTLATFDRVPNFGDSNITDIVATINSPISTVRLPNNSYRNVDDYEDVTTYSLSPSLPTGLIFNASNLNLSGTPRVITPTTSYTYTATFPSGDTNSLTFTITVVAEADTRPVAPSQQQEFTLPVALTPRSRTLRAFAGGNGVLTYALEATPSLPDWVTFNPATRQITVGPDTAVDQNLPRTTFTYTATDEDGDTTSATFTLTVDDWIPTFGDRTIPDIVGTQDSPIPRIRLPNYVSEDVVGTHFSISPSLPTGLTFDSRNRILSGTPRVVTPTTTYTYTANDYIGDSNSLTFTITVEEADTRPVAPTQSQDLIFTAGVPVNSGNTLRAFTGGDGTLTYALEATPSFPAGLSFNARTRRIEGTVPDNAGDDSFGLTRYTYSATDEDGDTTSATFTICVIDYVASFDGRSIANITAELDSRITSVTLPYAWSNSLYAGSQFSYPVLDNQRHSYFDYSLSPALPSGLTYNPNYRVLSGTPTVESPTTTYTYTATETASQGGGDSASLTFTITVEGEPDYQPIAPTQSQDLIFTAGVLVNSVNTLRAFTGGDGTLTYSLRSTPRLPAGLSFNARTRRIEGTVPDTLSDDSFGLTRYTYTATDEDGDTTSATFTICVIDYVASFDGRSIANFTATVDSPITSVTLPYAWSNSLYGGSQFSNPVLDNQRHSYFDYSLSPSLPTGLRYNPNYRVLSGTPTVASPTTTYTYTATEAVSNGGDSASLTFTITVEGEPDSRPVAPTNEQRFTFVVDGRTQSKTLEAFTGGDGTLTYTLASTPSLPDWLTFEPATRRITVGPDTDVNQYIIDKTFTYTATDKDGDTASATFLLNVYDSVAFFDSRSTIANITATVDSRITSVTLPYAWSNIDTIISEGEPDHITLHFTMQDDQLSKLFEYSLSPSLPLGLTFNAENHILSGTPRVASPTTTYTYTATEATRNGGGDTESLTFTITVEAVPSTPLVAPTQSQDLIFTAGVPVNSGNTLRAFTGGDGTLTYALVATPSFPAGLSFDAGTRRIEGTVPDTSGDDSFGLTRYTYTATDEDGDTTSATFTICVIDYVASFDGRSIANITAELDSPITSVTLPYAWSKSLYAGSQFSYPVLDNQRRSYFDYSLSPSLPQGLTYNPNYRVLSGTPAVVSPTTTYTYTATEATSHGGGDSDSITFTITVEAVPSTPLIAPTQSQDLIFTAGVPVNSGNTLRAFTGGDGTLTYALASTPSLPDWITFNPSTRRITVGPDSAVDQNLPTTTYTYTATDADGDTDSATFTITVQDYVPSFPASRTIADIVATQNSPIAIRTLPEVENIRGTYEYSLTPALPIGLYFYSSNRRLSGTPIIDTPTTTYTYTASDRVGDTDSLTFTITVEAEPDFPPAPPTQRPPSGQNLYLVAGTQPTSSSRTLYPFAGGTGTLTYTLAPSPSLPPGLTFNARTRMIEGVIPDSAGDDSIRLTTYTYTATDENDNSASTVFHISVYDDIASFEDRTIANITAMQNSPIDSVVLPYAYTHTQYAGEFSYKTLDNQFLSMFEYSLSPSLPAELTFNPSTRRLSGTPTVGSPTTTYTYTATEAIRLGGGDSASLTFTITVEEELDSLPVAPVISNLVFIPGQVVNETLPLFIGGDGVLTYSLTDGTNAVTALVGGLTYDPATRTISGTISSTPNNDSVVATNYTYSVIDSDVTLPDTVSVKFTISIVDDMPNFSGSSTIADITVLQNSAIASVTLPATIFGTGTLTYSLTPALPSGLEFSADDRVLSGTPVVGLTTTTYTYAVTDGDGDVDTLAFSITVIEDLQPTAPTGTQAYTFAVGQAVSTTLPAFTSGNGLLSYSLKPDLPWGLAFSSANRVLFGTPVNASQLTEYTYTATDEDGDSNSVSLQISVVPVVVEIPREIDTVVDTVPIAPPVLAFKFVPGQPVSETLPPFTGGNGILTYKLKATPALPSGLTFNANNRVLSGTLSANTAGDDSVPTTTYSYTATDEDGDTASASFSIEVLDLQLRAPVISDFTFTLDMPLNPITLPVFTSTLSTLLTYTLAPLPKGLIFNPATRVLAGIPVEEGKTTLTYTATDISGVSSVVTFIIDVMDVPPLEVATTNTLPSLGANIAQVATQAVSSRVELALNGQSQGVDIRTSEGQQFKFNAQNNGQSANSLARFGVWYSSSDDTLNSAGSALSWNGTTESTNVGLDVGFDLSSKASIVIGVMQNASSTSATYNSGGDSGKLDIDLDSTTFYVGFGYDWLDVWFANGNADSTLSDSVRNGLIPTSFAYQTIGLTAAFDFTNDFEVGAKVESLNSALSLSSREALNYAGLKSDSSQFRTAFFVNYKLDLGREGNAQLIPKFEMGYRGLKQNTSAQGSAPAAGTAAETSFGLDYHHRLLNLTVGFDVRSFEVQDYTSESMQWHIRWESGAYDQGLSLQLKPHSIAESLGGVEALYTSDYSQYQSMLARQYGGDTQATNDEGLDFEMGYGIIAKTGTFTPFVKATNIGTPRGVDSGRRTEEVGLRYEASTGLDLGLKMEQAFRPESSSSSMARESIVTFTTRYNF